MGKHANHPEVAIEVLQKMSFGDKQKGIPSQAGGWWSFC